MKKSLKYLAISTIAVCSFSACSEWTDIENKKIDVAGKTDEYYKQLREYKKSDHQVTFGWFGNWTGVGASYEKSLAGLPDSVDFVSLWGGWKNPTPAQLKDLRYVQQVKGTKALMVFIVQDIGDQLTPAAYSESLEKRKEYWGWKDGDDAAIKGAIEKYANAICDTIDKYKYDGFDIDYEPHYGHSGTLGGDLEKMTIFIETLSKRIGPKSNTGRLLVIDGEPQSIPSKTGPCFDWFIVQAYRCRGYADLNFRLSNTIKNFEGVMTPEEVAKKYIVTENFEDFALQGGYPFFRNPDYKSNTETPGVPRYIPSLKGMAKWQPTINGVELRKGGIGTYHMEYEFVVAGKTGTYPFLREALHIMNPSSK